MKKFRIKFSILTLVGLLLLSACDSIPHERLESKTVSYKIVSLTAPTYFEYSDTDSTLLATIEFTNAETIESVDIGMVSNDGSLRITPTKVENLFSTATSKTYRATFLMSQNYVSNNYIVNFRVFDNVNQSPDNIKDVASHKFYYNNATENAAPVLSNLLTYYESEDPILRDTVDQAVPIIFSVEAEDANSLTDINKVEFELRRPDNSVVGTFRMFDDGDPGHGDAVAGDGIFSLKNTFEGADSGTWKFEYIAVDRSGLSSNIINHNLYVR